jgi:hypothetical protein
MNKLHETLKRKRFLSGICHHMIFDIIYIKKLFEIIENKHNKPFYEVFLENIEKKYILYSGASEYEIYFNFMLIHYPEKIKIRKLNWKNTYNIAKDIKELKYDYVSYHHYNRS